MQVVVFRMFCSQRYTLILVLPALLTKPALGKYGCVLENLSRLVHSSIIHRLSFQSWLRLNPIGKICDHTLFPF